MNNPPSTAGAPGQADYFATTRWTVVVKAGQRSTPDSEQALQQLCLMYWYPLYAYVRHQGRSKEDAEDLTQAFFARFLQKNYLEGLSSSAGRFRAYLLASLKHFLANQREHDQRLKRGGEATLLSLDWQSAEERYRLEPVDRLSPDRLYDRAWALTLLEVVMQNLKRENEELSRAKLFEQLKPFLEAPSGEVPYAQLARDTGLAEGALRVAVHRLRRRYRQMLRQQIADTLADPGQVSEELQSLFAAFAA